MLGLCPNLWTASLLDGIDLFGRAQFYAPLTHSLILTRGTGDPTFTRATKAWEFGYAAGANAGADQVLMEIASGTARFGGARYDAGTWYNTYADGSAISASTLLGYHAEGARTNNLLYSRDLTPVSGYHKWVTTGIGSELVTNGTFTSDVSGWTNSPDGSVAWNAGGYADITVSSGYLGCYQAITCATGKHYTVSGTVVSGTGRVYINDTKTTTSSEGEGNLGGLSGAFSYTFTASATTMYVVLATSAASGSVSFDSISVKEAAIQPKLTATGIDGAANSATTLTAGAADATILQTITIAAAARSSSAYVKRRTGTGSVYMTRDGGSNWTDITSQINSSTWTRVKIENTSVTNPSVGFKIATSGDAIDVDCVQDEAGAFISSPIITTTAAVTRNGDVLTYATASNWSDTAGWAAASVYKPDWSYVAGGIIGSATNGLLPLTTNTGAKAYDSTNTVNGPTGTPSGTVKTAMTWGSGALQVAANGTAGTAGSYDGSWGLSSIGIGTSAGGMYVKNTYIAQAALTSTQLQQVTA